MSRIVFDLDGTLIDSAPDIHAAVARMLAGEELIALDLPTITSFIGNGLPKLVERVMQARDIDLAEHERLTGITLDYYNESPSALSELYPGLARLIPELKMAGHRLGVCTNKPQKPAQQMLKDFGIAQHFDVVIGGDMFEVKKPDPRPLLTAFELLGEGDRLYVGDSEVDAQTAYRAKVPFALFEGGYRKTPVEQLPHTYRFEAFSYLGGIIAGHRE